MELAQNCCKEVFRQHDEFGRHIGDAVGLALTSIPCQKPGLEKKEKETLSDQTWNLVNAEMCRRGEKAPVRPRPERSQPIVGVHTRDHQTLITNVPKRLKRPEMVDIKVRQLPRGQRLDDLN